MRMTVRELKEYIFALKIVKSHKPLLSVTQRLELYPEITELETLLENTLNALPFPRHGQKQINIEIPPTLQNSVPLNKSIRYGIPLVCASNRSRKKEISLLDSVYGIATANKLIPNGANDYRILTTEEEGKV